MKKRITAMVLVLVVLLGCFGCSIPKKRQPISIYLWSGELMTEYAPFLQEQLPHIDLKFVVGQNDLDFYQYLEEQGRMPDIIVNRRFSLKDGKELDGMLADLSGTEAAGGIYLSYLDNYTNEEGEVKWLPLCGEVDGYVANKKLFDAYNIPLPTDEESFRQACQRFEANGIRGFASDYAYDYTCLEVLQSLWIPQLSSVEGIQWRRSYEMAGEGEQGLDKNLWMGAFQRLERFLKDTGAEEKDVYTTYEDINDMFLKGQVAIIRETGSQLVNYSQLEQVEPVMLPYFGTRGEQWLLTYPNCHVAVSKEKKRSDEEWEEIMEVLQVMFSEQGQQVLADNRDLLSYSKDVDLKCSQKFANLQSCVEQNHIYIRIATEEFYQTSRQVVQGMVKKKYSAKEACDVFDRLLRQREKKREEKITCFEEGISDVFSPSKGNMAASAMSNTLAGILNADVLVAPAYCFSGSIYSCNYTKEQIRQMICENDLTVESCELTGQQTRDFVEWCIQQDCYGVRSFNQYALPCFSGVEVEVKKQNQSFIVTKLTKDGMPLEEKKRYRVVCLKLKSRQGMEEEGWQEFKEEASSVKRIWVSYFREGGQLKRPKPYIKVQ